MAWDALGSIFKKKDDQGTQEAQQSYAPTGVGGGAGAPANAPATMPYAGYGGTGGSTGGSVSAKFTNFGTLYDLNSQAAQGMAKNIGSAAQAAADKAKQNLQGARDTFNQQEQAGAGNWGPVGGQHGTRIETGQAPTQPPAPPANKPSWEGTSNTGQINTIHPGGGITAGGLQGVVAKGEDAASAAAGAQRTGAFAPSRYDSLFGPMQSAGGVGKVDQSALADYHVSARPIDAASGAGQSYTGPASLKDAIGEDAYAALQDSLSKGEKANQNLTTAGGIENALGYGPGAGGGSGNAALDAGLTQVAGQAQFKRNADATKGMSNLLPQAQADSMRAATGADIQSSAAAKQWKDLLDQYNASNGASPSGAITIGAAGSRLGRASGTDSGTSRTGKPSGDAAGTGRDNSDSMYSGTNPDFNKGPGGTTGGLWPTGMTHDPNASWQDGHATDDEQAWQSYWAGVDEATKEQVANMTPAERQAWADAQWAKLKGGS